MSLKKSQDSRCYMDGVKVKIAEEYKPPPKINLLMTHSQRLMSNKQIQNNLPNYDFSMESNLLQKVREWKNNRKIIEDERKKRLQVLKEKEVEETETEEECSPEAIEAPVTENEKVISSIGPNYTTTYANGVLLPTKVTNYYSNILQPIPLNSGSQKFSNNNSEIKSPFNISEFEADTSSPFDNVALKSINDVEELAKVLKIEDVAPRPSTTVSYSNFQIPNLQTFPNYTSISNIIPNSSSYSIHNSATAVNGYYTSSDLQSLRSFPSNYQCSPPLNNYLATYTPVQSTHHENIPLNDENHAGFVNFSTINNSSKISPESHLHETKTHTTSTPVRKISVVDLPDPFDELPKHLQDLSKSISSMGFPLSRVARTCKAIGNDNKKVVDHLLAMSELLVLGFPEDKVSEALLLYDNDRDKALDKLIS